MDTNLIALPHPTPPHPKHPSRAEVGKDWWKNPPSCESSTGQFAKSMNCKNSCVTPPGSRIGPSSCRIRKKKFLNGNPVFFWKLNDEPLKAENSNPVLHTARPCLYTWKVASFLALDIVHPIIPAYSLNKWTVNSKAFSVTWACVMIM